ncbi:hypothetical protein [Phytohabitans aurantiacus]|uniref:Uncharacterized protein n=1 Tax=Phytohabitans aurantiacus TaxID=3016789 RepID=A0ABQ5QW87_9ACTN|nr:hypothetical protein [Phytohabitans aurantiacus]GLH98833.1 hypothetical protein Pa4123_41080 [Phytohabitans aurantiacus]
MIQTFIVYGHQLGGPGNWNLVGFNPGDPLRVPWYDETDPTHDFPERAIAEITDALPATVDRRRIRHNREARLPFWIDAAVDLSPPGWTREANAPPGPAYLLPPTSDVYALDRPTTPRYVLIIFDSAQDIESADHARYNDEDEQVQLRDHRIDWDSLLDAALTELGLQAPGLPDWFWYRTGTL